MTTGTINLKLAVLRFGRFVVRCDWTLGVDDCRSWFPRELVAEVRELLPVWVPWGDGDDLDRYLVTCGVARWLAAMRGYTLIEEGDIPGPSDFDPPRTRGDAQ